MNVRLLNITPAIARLCEDPDAFERAQGASFGNQSEAIKGVVAMTETFRSRNGAPPEWGGYLAIDTEKERVIGTCAFKGSPIDGVVEIAYFTFPPFERKGYGTAMAAELVRLCRPTPAVRRIIAHTLPEKNPSTAILEKNGFTKIAEISEVDDGPLWRWELEK
jgi:ribosomal-protein-alanine N-acetyltransferase